MAVKVQAAAGMTGYMHQLDRARRFLDRVQRHFDDWNDMNDVEFQDDMWSFFQHCWHIKDWVKNDPQVWPAQVKAVSDMAHGSATLKICQDLCNGTKHLELKSPKSGVGASHKRVDIYIGPGEGRFELDCMIDDGLGNPVSGKQLARDCIAEWEGILQAQGLAIERMS